MKSIICELEKYDVIGFDLDGTLYDELDFVKQVYRGVAAIISDFIHVDADEIWNQLIIEWLKVGSSGSVFQNVLYSYGVSEPNKDIIKDCIRAYRESPFLLSLPDRTRIILEYLKARGKKLYLVTDGNSELQRKKIKSLNINEWIFYYSISGDYGKEFQKPSPYMFEQLSKCFPEIRNSVYCGDRDIDKQFATSIGVDFLCVKNMCII